jgi:hypothetical protein
MLFSNFKFDFIFDNGNILKSLDKIVIEDNFALEIEEIAKQEWHDALHLFFNQKIILAIKKEKNILLAELLNLTKKKECFVFDDEEYLLKAFNSWEKQYYSNDFFLYTFCQLDRFLGAQANQFQILDNHLEEEWHLFMALSLSLLIH